MNIGLVFFIISIFMFSVSLPAEAGVMPRMTTAGDERPEGGSFTPQGEGYTLEGTLTREDGQKMSGVLVVFESNNGSGSCTPDGDVDIGCVDQLSTTSLVNPLGYYTATLKHGIPYRITVQQTSTTAQKIIAQQRNDDPTVTEVTLNILSRRGPSPI